MNVRRIGLVASLLLAALFLLSAALNLGVRIPLGFTELRFVSPSPSIAALEALIGAALLGASAFSNSYLYGGAYLLATVGIAEGLLSAGVQGAARELHETMIPFLLLAWVCLALEVRSSYRAKASGGERRRQVVLALQLFNGGLVTLGGLAYAALGAHPWGTVVGLGHLAVGVSGLAGGLSFLRRKVWSAKFLVWINVTTIVYSAFSEGLAEVYALLTPGVGDSLIGTIIAIVVSAVVLYLVTGSTSDFDSATPARPEVTQTPQAIGYRGIRCRGRLQLMGAKLYEAQAYNSNLNSPVTHHYITKLPRRTS